MGTKFSEDVVPITDLKLNPGRVVKQVATTHETDGIGAGAIEDGCVVECDEGHACARNPLRQGGFA